MANVNFRPWRNQSEYWKSPGNLFLKYGANTVIINLLHLLANNRFICPSYSVFMVKHNCLWKPAQNLQSPVFVCVSTLIHNGF